MHPGQGKYLGVGDTHIQCNGLAEEHLGFAQAPAVLNSLQGVAGPQPGNHGGDEEEHGYQEEQRVLEGHRRCKYAQCDEKPGFAQHR